MTGHGKGAAGVEMVAVPETIPRALRELCQGIIRNAGQIGPGLFKVEFTREVIDYLGELVWLLDRFANRSGD